MPCCILHSPSLQQTVSARLYRCNDVANPKIEIASLHFENWNTAGIYPEVLQKRCRGDFHGPEFGSGLKSSFTAADGCCGLSRAWMDYRHFEGGGIFDPFA